MILLNIFTDFPPWLLAILIFLVGAYFGAYLKERGKYRAMEEKIVGITETVESVKIALSDQSHNRRENHDREKKSYEVIWDAFVKAQDANLQIELEATPYLNPEYPCFTKLRSFRKFDRSVDYFKRCCGRNAPYVSAEIATFLDPILDEIKEMEVTFGLSSGPFGSPPKFFKTERKAQFEKLIRERREKISGA